jgi:hypothetical protein
MKLPTFKVVWLAFPTYTLSCTDSSQTFPAFLSAFSAVRTAGYAMASEAILLKSPQISRSCRV